jgi:virulence factor
MILIYYWKLVAAPVIQLNASGSQASDAYVTATLGFANGIIATLTASKVSHRKRRSIVAHCKSSLTEADFLNNQIFNSSSNHRRLCH